MVTMTTLTAFIFNNQLPKEVLVWCSIKIISCVGAKISVIILLLLLLFHSFVLGV